MASRKRKSVPPSSALLSVKQVASRFDVTILTIWRWELQGRLPRALRLSRGTVRWREREINRHLIELKPVSAKKKTPVRKRNHE